MRRAILTILLFSTWLILCAQDQEEILNARPLNSVSLNLLGDVSLISINYERLIPVSPAFILSNKLGLGHNEEFRICLFGSCPPAREFFTIPHHITGNIGKGIHFFEIGLGGTIVNKNQPYYFYPIVGYRILPRRSARVNFRLFGLLPLSVSSANELLFISPFGLNLGISF